MRSTAAVAGVGGDSTARMRAPAQCWLTDMDGVLVREEHALPGAAEFLARLTEKERPFLVLTNNSIFTPPAIWLRG